jgi:hypothetical protein
VIDDTMILKALEEYEDDENTHQNQSNNQQHSSNSKTRKQTPAASVGGSKAAVEFSSVLSLALSFQNIFKIQNLNNLYNLTKLKLDNNIICNIENLSMLSNLTWLDLSFNNIEDISGLEKMTNLTDLSLFNNNIKKIGNMDALINLQVLSIGNNDIETVESLLYLRTMQNLRVLNIKGNPVCHDAEYRYFILAYLDKIKFLDYGMVSKEEIQTAKEQYQDELEEWKEVKAVEDAAKFKDNERKVRRELLENGNLEGIDSLFNDMIAGDTEIDRLLLLTGAAGTSPSVQDLLDQYREKVSALTKPIIEYLLEKTQEAKTYTEEFNDAIGKNRKENQLKAIAVIDKYNEKVRNMIRRGRNFMLSNETGGGGALVSPSRTSAGSGLASMYTVLKEANPDEYKELLDDVATLQNEAADLTFALINTEVTQVEQNSEMLDIFEAKCEAWALQSRDILAEYFRNVEELENVWSEQMVALGNHLMECISTADADDEDFNDDQRELLSDRETLLTCINSSHDIHIGRMLTQEDDIQKKSNGKQKAMLDAQKKEEWNRNRDRMAEITHLEAQNKEDLEKFLKSITDDMDEY